jgi:hypothetical protein
MSQSHLILRLRSPSSAARRSASTKPAKAVSVKRGASRNPMRSFGVADLRPGKSFLVCPFRGMAMLQRKQSAPVLRQRDVA